MGEARERFSSAPTLLSESGLAPVTRASGRTRQVRFRYAANRRSLPDRPPATGTSECHRT
uniref:hypothetical protein n=1 Tax=Rhodococcus qingshengii TaxID=334542 RepID=UPI0035564155